MKFFNGFVDRLPEIGGASGAATASIALITWESIIAAVISAFIFTVVGGVGGYLLKLLLDRVFRRSKKVNKK